MSEAGDRFRAAEHELIAAAIPPAYTELIGHQIMQHLEAKAAA